MIIGEIICGTAFHQGEWFVVKVDVFPQNGSDCGALGDQPPVPDEVEVCTVDVQPCQKSTADVTPLFNHSIFFSPFPLCRNRQPQRYQALHS